MMGLLPQKIDVETRASTTDGQGGFTEDWAVSSTVRGRIRPVRGGERTVGNQDQALVTHIAYLRSGSDVSIGNRLSSNKVTVEVLAEREPGSRGHHIELDCKEIQHG